MPVERHGWKTLASKEVYRNPWIAVREDSVVYPGGRPGIYGVVEKGPGVAVIALTERDEIYLIRQYRYTVDRVMVELPAGAIADGGNELEAAKRELMEEAGITARGYTRLGNFFTAAGHETAEIIVYLATGLDGQRPTARHQQHDESILEILAVPVPEVRRMVRDNEIVCGITLASLNIFFQQYPDRP